MNNTGAVKADLLRLNTSIAPCTADSATDNDGMCRALGVFPTDPAADADDYTPDLQGFLNGRRLGDDVTDIEIRAVAQGYGPVLNSLFGLPNLALNNIVGDGLGSNDDMPQPAPSCTSACPTRATSTSTTTASRRCDPRLHHWGRSARCAQRAGPIRVSGRLAEPPSCRCVPESYRK